MLAAAVVLMSRFAPCTEPPPPTPPEDAAPVAEPLPTIPAYAPRLRAEPRGLKLTALLLADGASPPAQARLGLLAIREEDLATWEEERREGGNAPSSPLALANVESWVEAPLSEEAGGWRLGPIEVPEAVGYRVAAWGEEGSFWIAELIRREDKVSGLLDAGALHAQAPTGLQFEVERGGRFKARLTRAEAGEEVEQALAVTRLARPELARALESEALLDLEDGAIWAPLPPDRSVELTVISEAGREATPLRIPLREGRLERVRIDPQALFPEGLGRTVTLRGRLLLDDGGALPDGARLERIDPVGEPVALSPEGRFELPVPDWTTSHFAVALPREDGRPRAPERFELEFRPEGEGEVFERSWAVPAYGWLLLTLGDGARVRLEGESHRPYPIFALERSDDAGTWQVESTDEFLREPGGLAISLTRPGGYRILAAASPFDLHRSGELQVTRIAGEHRLRLEVLDFSTPRCRLQVLDAGEPLYGVRVVAAGATRSLPPLRGYTDGAGRFDLGRVAPGSPVLIELETPSGAVRPVDATAACRDGEVVVSF